MQNYKLRIICPRSFICTCLRGRWKGRVGNCPLLSTIRTGLTAEWATNLSQERNRQEIEARGTDLRVSPHKHTYAGTHICTIHTETHTLSSPRVPQHLHCSVSERLIILTRKQLAGRERHGKLVITVIIITIIIISLSSSRSPSSGSGASYWVETMKCQEATCAECKIQRLGENRVDSLHSFDFSFSPYFGLPHPPSSDRFCPS